MNILIVDTQACLRPTQVTQTRNRLRFSLARFEHRINGVTMHFDKDDTRNCVSCTININVEGSGMVVVRRSSRSMEQLINTVMDAVEFKVGRRVDWRAWFNADSLATPLVATSWLLRCLLGQDSLNRIGGRQNATLPSQPHFRVRGHSRLAAKQN